ncbi:hypothetical protein P4646_19990 [Peribacillus simplex]|uniref:hypothetical protein n=1 Tax=Peribacillus simplex TaxID=1478 RepID=UPI002E1A7E73|nr:hypothetical protein [Peribacillus simplex]MED4096813.1 hypothetical protein [Peribacillus simplex]
MIFTQEVKTRIQDALISKGANKPCSVCNSKDLVLVDELILSDKSSGGKFPTIVTGCGNCGKIETFAANTLVPGLLPNGKVGEY